MIVRSLDSRTRRPSSDTLWWTASWLYIALYGTGCLAAIAWTGLHVDLNDFWGNVALAQQADVLSPASLYNPFFPFGYALVLRLFGQQPVVPAHLLNVAFGLLLLGVVWRFGTRLIGAPGAFVAVILLSIHPQVFRYVTTPGPDTAVAALSALGFTRLFPTDRDEAADAWRLLSAGAILGIAALLRYHALVFAGTAILATTIGHSAPVPRVRLALAGLFAVYALQMAVAVVAHHSPFHTGQAFIFYKLVHGVNWLHVGTETPPLTVWGVISESPAAFASAYLRALAPLCLLPLAPAVVALIAPDPLRRRFGVVAFLTTASYAIVVASGGSSRGSLPIRFLVALSVVTLARELVAPSRARRPGPRYYHALTAVGLVLFVAWSLTSLRADYGIVKHRAQANSSYRRIETVLRQDGVLSAKQVFSSDLTLYFPALPGYTPRTNGTWLRLDDGRYSARFPELCVATAECLVRDARTLGVTHVVLAPNAGDLSPAIARVYGATSIAGLELRGRELNFNIFGIR